MGTTRLRTCGRGPTPYWKTSRSTNADGADSIGAQGGQVANDRFYDIFLAAGVDGTNNNFGEILYAPS